MLARLMKQPHIEVEIVSSSGGLATYWLNPESQRPVRDLPAGFWIQSGVGLAGFWFGLWVWILRPGE